MTRRANQEGSVYKRKDGRWVASITLDNGKRKSIYCKTQQEAVKAARDVNHLKDQGIILDAAKGDPFEALYVLALTTGMRQGELLGLKWEDIDLAMRTLQVKRTIARLVGKGFITAEPKTTKSRRRIQLTKTAIEALRQHRTRQREAKLAAGSAWNEQGWVFCNAIGGPVEVGNMIRRSFRPILVKAELPIIRFHDLRHSAASLLLALGVHAKIVQELLGHSQISLTLDTYSHVLPSLQEEAVNRLDELLSR
jgi:integrase